MTGPTVPNRKTVRKFFATMLEAELGSLVQEVYDHQTDSLLNQSPVVSVVSGPISRGVPNLQMLALSASIQLDVHVFVRYQDSSSTPKWTEAMSEDRADDIEAAIAKIVLVYGDNTEGEKKYNGQAIPWLSATIVGTSDIDSALMDNIDYRHEAIYVSFVANNSE